MLDIIFIYPQCPLHPSYLNKQIGKRHSRFECTYAISNFMIILRNENIAHYGIITLLKIIKTILRQYEFAMIILVHVQFFLFTINKVNFYKIYENK